MRASLAILQKTPGRLHGEVAWVWGRSCDWQWKIRVLALAGPQLLVAGGRVRHGMGPLGNSSFKIRVETFLSTGGLAF